MHNSDEDAWGGCYEKELVSPALGQGFGVPRSDDKSFEVDFEFAARLEVVDCHWSGLIGWLGHVTKKRGGNFKALE